MTIFKTRITQYLAFSCKDYLIQAFKAAFFLGQRISQE